LAEHYQKLLKVTRKIFRISDIQGQSLQRHQNEIQNLMDNVNQGFLTFGPDLKVDSQYSAECAKIFGKKIGGMLIHELLGKGNETSSEKLREILQSVFSCHKEFVQTELAHFPSNFRLDEKTVHIECKLIPQADEANDHPLVMMIITDITEKLRADDQIKFLSYHDKLTSLHNRAHIERILPEMEKTESMPLSIIMADMNGLKLVNDVFGHQQGDLLLLALARSLQKACRKTDIIARWGGDEFVILLPGTDKEACRRVCERIQQACDEVADCAIPLSVAIGTATKDEGIVRLAEMFSVAENKMYNDKLLKNRKVRKAIVANLEDVLISRKLENIGHLKRVKELAQNFIEYLGIEPSIAPVKLLDQLVQLHDIGKVSIPAEILRSDRPLTPIEWEIIKSHSEIGYRMAQSIGEPAVADLILSIHERWDGGGYPLGLVGDQSPLLARLFAIVDVYDVICHDRPYRLAVDRKTALQEIESGAGSQFDPNLAIQFVKMIKKS
jgi:diguanylate cyclase (GGDEF)-like protein